MRDCCRSSGVEHVLGKDDRQSQKHHLTPANTGVSAITLETPCFPCVPAVSPDVPTKSGRSRGEKRVLRLNLKREYFDTIRDGTKTEEYRLVMPYWSKRLDRQTYDEIHLMMGYPKKGDMSRTLVRAWWGVRVKTITHPHFGDKSVQVFAIDVTRQVRP